MSILPAFPKIHFDFGAVRGLEGELIAHGVVRPLFITDEGLVEHGVFEKLRAAIPSNVDYTLFDKIPENPTVAGVEAAAAAYRENDCDGIVALGGGSVLDSGKSIRIVVSHEGELQELAANPERIKPGLPTLITLPTTAGTGAEITAGGGIHPAPDTHAFGVRSPHIQPSVAICDPDLTLALPPRLTAGTGMDALGHCVEGIFAPTVNPPVEAIALDGIRRVCTYIERAVEDGTDREARWHLLMAALEGGMAIYKGLGPVHTLAHIFGDRPVHHGAAVAIATPAVVRFCAGDVGDKGDKILDAMGLARGSDLADGIAQLNERVGIPATMREIGYDGQDVDGLAQMGHENWFNATAPRHPSVAEYREMIVELLGT